MVFVRPSGINSGPLVPLGKPGCRCCARLEKADESPKGLGRNAERAERV